VTESRPTAASAKPIIIDEIGLPRLSLLMPTNAGERQEVDGEVFRRTELEGEVRHDGERNVITITATSAPMKDDVNAAVSAWPARPSAPEDSRRTWLRPTRARPVC